MEDLQSFGDLLATIGVVARRAPAIASAGDQSEDFGVSVKYRMPI